MPQCLDQRECCGYTLKQIILDVVKVAVPLGWGIAMFIGFFVYGLQASRWIPAGVCLFNSFASFVTLVDVLRFHITRAHRYHMLATETQNKNWLSFKVALTSFLAVAAVGAVGLGCFWQ
jgi:hypothetical protein